MKIRTARQVALTALVSLAVSIACPALAHGPGVKMSRQGFDPAELTIPVGQVVHFTCLEHVPRGLRVRGDDGTWQSPRLSRGEGFHHTFEKPGTYRYHLEQDESVKGTIIVQAAEE